MKFISSGDFAFPLHWLTYLVDHLYILTNAGAMNIDNIIRLYLRLPYIVAFSVTNNLIVAYLYYATILIFSWFAFYWFAREFFPDAKRLDAAIAASIFVINPIVLANSAKIGLVLGASTLPFLLVIAKRYFDTKRPAYLLALVLSLNLLLIHPFTLFLDIAVVAGYALWRLRRDRERVKVLRQVAIAGAVCVLLFAFVLLPVALTAGGLDRNQLSVSLTEGPKYSSIVTYSNTKTLTQSFTLSRPVFKDFEYYNVWYYPLYILATISLLALATLSLFRRRQEPVLLLAWGALLLLFLLAAMNFSSIVRLTVYVVDNLPLGWMFRSPLKWQLYIPFCYAIILHQVLHHTDARRRKMLLGMTVLLVALSAAYIAVDVHSRLLTPKEFRYFDDSLREDLAGKQLLVVRNKMIVEVNRTDYSLLEELKMLELSHDTRLTQLHFDRKQNLSKQLLRMMDGYDYLLAYRRIEDPAFVDGGRFENVRNLTDGYLLYKSSVPTRAIYPQQLDYVQISPVEYRVLVRDTTSPVNITLNVPYRREWGMYLENVHELDDGTRGLFGHAVQLDALRYLWREEFFEETHGTIDRTQNTWTVYPQPSGSETQVITLYYRSQAYFILGMIISLCTVAGSLVWYWMRGRG